MVPPVAVISVSTKSADSSDNVNVNPALSPAFNEVTSEVIPIVGIIVSTGSVMEPALLFSFPAASLNAEAETLITPLSVLSSVGVNVAV